jgi:hypothetical protein
MVAFRRGNPTAQGKDTGVGIRRQSIAQGELIPNVAVFFKRTTLEFLQVIFNQRAPESFHYDEDDQQSRIIIADVHAVDLKTVGSRPAIVAVRGPLSWTGTGLGGSSLEKRDVATGKYTFNDLLTGSQAISCISREGVEAEQIAHIVFNSLKWFQPVLRKYGFFSVKSLNIGAEQLIETEGADDKTYLVPVYLTAQIQDRWALDTTAERNLQKIVSELQIDIE